MSGAGVTFFSPGLKPSPIAPANGEAMDGVRHHNSIDSSGDLSAAMDGVRLHNSMDGSGDLSAEAEQVVLERLLLSSLTRDKADQP